MLHDGVVEMEDLLFCSRYPFTRKAKECAERIGIGLSSSVIEKAEKRLREAAVEGRIRKVAEIPEAMREELAVYATCRMIISSASSRYLIGRYAVAEAKRAREYLDSDELSKPENIDAVAEDLGLAFEKAEDGFLLPFWLYLPFTPRSLDYKLSNRQLAAGKVLVKRSERRRIIEEAVRIRIESSLPIKADFPKEIQEAGKRILGILPKLEASALRLDERDYPPCIRKLLEDLAMNANVPHIGRVALAIYLVNAGLSDDKIVDFFRHAPDFSEKITRYQVEHVRAKKYRMASCSTMDSWGLCVADCRCGNPLNYKESVHGKRLKAEGKKVE
ncbi:MAG: hypothetical protein N3F07_03890 [Candidatus Micrarchaeota archaeon]|nr:hypothetical protein [Candidatus Micrarchaeota archaeon]